jgi:hypothetical protein
MTRLDPMQGGVGARMLLRSLLLATQREGSFTPRLSHTHTEQTPPSLQHSTEDSRR